MERSEAYRDGHFHNRVVTPIRTAHRSFLATLYDFLKGGEGRRPDSPVPTTQPDLHHISIAPDPSLRVTWLGHSTSIIEIEGLVLLTDPVLVSRPSPLPGLGPKAFPGSIPVNSDSIPRVDAIVISHDHYDHLDRKTILCLQNRTDQIIVPLGVAAHLRRWGIPKNKIIELDWWESYDVGERITLTATPAQHFSGRNPFEQNRTLWTGWAIRGEKHSIFFGGDSGYAQDFTTIRERLGPFDITMLDSAQYSIYWPSIHMNPEEVVRAHQDLGGSVLLPIHWGKFNLSLHPWTEPIERILSKAERVGIKVAAPVIGGSFKYGDPTPHHPWWRS